ncbi:3-isopropylmalate/(R)-2-methylmalate dehydratase small subunit [Melghirimyces profundicolus]|uniref:3-isopropylmalate dehydratase small subunit n=1 Tax=Melghirimyces profundicolus TaxID=1242148 RepID=A0A2T6BGC9_9BACL|nr:3-isopropylmalate dehydratase small subunit [Melghirimyces profundicolus]PTX55125.1 3-isopropylmalate/(R)-2-methylmalate dehydratase small subunit [Melghirimyces profundicolus]
MEAFTKHTGKVVPLDRANVDTDQIIPKQFLKRVERTGFGQYLFYNWRFDMNGNPDPEFELNREEYAGGTILLTRTNFGCGSSREHAPWALLDFGFRVVIAPTFADIFYNNCFKNGILPIRLPEKTVDTLFQRIETKETRTLTVDLEETRISDGNGFTTDFEVEPYRRYCLLNGLDDIAITLQKEEQIHSYEENIPQYYRIEKEQGV